MDFFLSSTSMPKNLYPISAWLTGVRKRLLRWLLVCLLLSLPVLSGCSRPVATDTDVIRLTLWQGVNPPPNRDVLQTLIDRFNQTHPGIQVQSLYVGQPDQQMPKILAAVVGRAVPDLLWFNPTITGQLVELEAIQPLSTMELQGHLWSVPFATNNPGIFYRPSLFAAAGITQIPQTWSELRQAARTLTQDTNGDGRVDQHGILLSLGKGEFTVFTWLPFLWSAGGEIEAAPGTEPTSRLKIQTSGAEAALQFWLELIEDGSAVLSQPERGYELDNFLAGKVAMQISGPWTLAQLQASGADFAVMPIPTQQRPATALGGENLFVFKTNPARERAAFTFAEYVIGAEFQTEWALKTGYLPVNLKSRESSAYQQFRSEQPTLEVFLEQMAVARSRPIFAGYSRVSENLGRALEATLLQRSTPAEALQASQQRLDLIFDPGS
jgi:multiple sugar transport system substrate-binding protein